MIAAFLMYNLPLFLDERSSYPKFQPVAYYLSHTTLIGTVWTILTMTIDR